MHVKYKDFLNEKKRKNHFNFEKYYFIKCENKYFQHIYEWRIRFGMAQWLACASHVGMRPTGSYHDHYKHVTNCLPLWHALLG